MIKKKNKAIVISASLLTAILLVIFAYRYTSKRIEFYGHYDKVWAHRVNDLKKLKSSQNKFEGLELDLVYQKEEKLLDIYHSPTPSTGLSFTEYAKHINNKNLGLWLDLKNLNSENQTGIFKLIDEAIVLAELDRSNIIIESSRPELLAVFGNHGYRISYYVPAEMYLKKEEEITQAIDLITDKINNNPQLEISAYFEDYPILAKNFPQQKKNLWVLHSTFSPKIIHKYRDLRLMLKDSSVETVLTPYINFNKHF